MNEDLVSDVIYKSDKGKIIIYESTCKNEPSYCIEYIPLGVRRHIDYDKAILDDLVSKLNRVGGIDFIDGKSGYRFKIRNGKREHCISLRAYLYARYNSLPVNTVRRMSRTQIMTHDGGMDKDLVLDFRSSNLYDRYSENDKLKIIERVGHPNEKYITASDNGRTEIQDYSEGLYEVLGRISILLSSYHNRLHATIARDGNKTGGKLSRLVLMYYEFYSKFKNMNGSVKRFTKWAIDNSKGIDLECGHINAESWNNCRNNVMLMTAETNREMHDYIKWFKGCYNANAIVYYGGDTPVILVELTSRGTTYYVECKTAEEYTDLQRTLLGKNSILGGKKQTETGEVEVSAFRPFEDSWYGEQAYTPGQERERLRREENGVKEEYSEERFSEWCDMRDRLIKLYTEHREIFFTWRVCKEGINMDALDTAMFMYHFLLGLPLSGGHCYVRVDKIKDAESA